MSGAEERSQIIERDVSVQTFVEKNEQYYSNVFERIQRRQLSTLHLNPWALLIPWFWAAQRGVWFIFWCALALDVLGLVCLMQVVKFTPLLEIALENPDANPLLIERYQHWISAYSWIGAIVLLIGRIVISSTANRSYYRQYNKWRIDVNVASGIALKRIITALLIISIGGAANNLSCHSA